MMQVCAAKRLLVVAPKQLYEHVKRVGGRAVMRRGGRLRDMMFRDMWRRSVVHWRSGRGTGSVMGRRSMGWRRRRGMIVGLMVVSLWI